MNFWKKTYVITALCMIAAGVIYLLLPLSKESEWQKAEKETEALEPAELLGNVLYRMNENWIETSNGKYMVSENTQWIANGQLMVNGKSRFLGKNVFLTGDNEGMITKVETQQDLSMPQRLRIVLAEDAAIEDYLHSKVAVSCESAFWSIQDGSVCAHPPGAEIEIGELVHRSIFFTARESDALTLVTANGTAVYQGQLEVTADHNGDYCIVNEVPLETYLKGVVPAEMPGSYGEEAAKVQAVCARSYACRQWLNSDKFAVWGAHMDDSTRSQVYGGVIEHEASIKGVEDTWGQILVYDEQPIAAHYFSTSCGYTASADEVWGGSRPVYETGTAQYTEGVYGNLGEEEAFHAFITDDAVQAFDQHSPWFRWSVLLNMETLQEMIDRYFSEPRIVKVVKEYAMESKEIDGIGSLVDLFVYERSETGMVKAVVLVGSEITVVIETPMEIRRLLGGISVELANGEAAGERELFPSAFFSIEKTKDTKEKLVSIKICGGGYGHGVGMSQNGVKGMVDAGYSYQHILGHYFPHTVLTNL